MKFLYVLLLVLKFYCLYHVVKNDKPAYWIVLLIIIPGVSFVYIFFHIILKSDLKNVQSEINSVINPNSKIEALEKRFQHSDNFNSKMALADAYLASERRDEALELYESCLDGLFKDDIHFQLQLGLCYFELKQFKKAAFTLINVKNSVEFKRTKYHLAYALSLDGMGKMELALEQFQLMSSEKGNFEYRFHFAMFLSNSDKKEEAIEILEKLLREIYFLESTKKPFDKIWKEKAETLLGQIKL